MKAEILREAAISEVGQELDIAIIYDGGMVYRLMTKVMDLTVERVSRDNARKMRKKKIVRKLQAELDKLKAEQPLNKHMAHDVITAADEVIWLPDTMEENVLSITRRGAIQPATIKTEREVINYLKVRKVYTDS